MGLPQIFLFLEIVSFIFYVWSNDISPFSSLFPVFNILEIEKKTKDFGKSNLIIIVNYAFHHKGFLVLVQYETFYLNRTSNGTYRVECSKKRFLIELGTHNNVTVESYKAVWSGLELNKSSGRSLTWFHTLLKPGNIIYFCRWNYIMSQVFKN